MDNFSRYVLAWKVSRNYGGLRTKELLHEARANAQFLGLAIVPNVLVDSGTKNINEHLDQLVLTNQISRAVVQIDIEASNSMVEMLFHRLKHRYLFIIPLTNFDVLTKAVDFYLIESNECIPHSALNGATPKEVFTGKWNHENLEEIKNKITVTKSKRIESNRSSRCLPCLA